MSANIAEPGGDAGGKIVGMAPPEKLAEGKNRSHTARVLGPFLAERLA